MKSLPSPDRKGPGTKISFCSDMHTTTASRFALTAVIFLAQIASANIVAFPKEEHSFGARRAKWACEQQLSELSLFELITSTPVPMFDEPFKAQLQRRVNNLPLSAVIALFDSIHHDKIDGSKRSILFLDSLFARMIFAHPAGVAERTDALKSALKMNAFDYMDELMGIPHEEIESSERHTQFVDPYSVMREVLGIGQKHKFWFSNYFVLTVALNRMVAQCAHTVADLGSGTGRLGLLIGFLYPEMNFYGVELYGPRVQAAQEAAKRWGFQNRIHFVQQDLLDSSQPLPVADVYYAFGPTNAPKINDQVLTRLGEFAHSFKILSQHENTISLLKAKSWAQATGWASLNLREFATKGRAQ